MPETIGSVVGVYNGKVRGIEVKPDGRPLPDDSITRPARRRRASARADIALSPGKDPNRGIAYVRAPCVRRVASLLQALWSRRISCASGRGRRAPRHMPKGVGSWARGNTRYYGPFRVYSARAQQWSAPRHVWRGRSLRWQRQHRTPGRRRPPSPNTSLPSIWLQRPPPPAAIVEVVMWPACFCSRSSTEPRLMIVTRGTGVASGVRRACGGTR